MEPDAVSPQAELEPPIDAESTPEFPAHEPEPVTLAAAEFLAASAPEFAESQDHAPRVDQASEEVPSESPIQADAATQEALDDSVSVGGGAPQTIDIEAELSTRYATYPEAGLAPEPAPESEEAQARLSDEWREALSDESREPLWGEARRGSLEEEPLAEAQASPSQDSEDGAGSDAESAEVVQSGMPGDAPLVDAGGVAARDAESWTGPEYAPSSPATAVREDATPRRNAVWASEDESVLGNAVRTNGSAIYSGEPEPAGNSVAGRRGRPAPTVSRPDSGRRSRAVLSIVALVVLAAIVIGWWWLVSRQPEQKAEVHRPPQAAAPQPIATGPIEKRSEALEIVGKDFELRVEPATPGKAAATQAPAAPASRNEIVHVVARGDTLWDIAAKHLGNPYRYPELARNSAIRNPDLIHPGDVVRIRKRR
jgi:hypothetical protein